MITDTSFDVPVAIFIFNRPSTTKRVFDRIRLIKPRKLLIVADGARNEAERILCQESISIVENTDWNCTIERNYSRKNLGVVTRFVTGLDWIFSICEEAIILEDDCLPDVSFFHYCRRLLEKYRFDDNVMLVSGQTMTPPGKFTTDSYYFSRFALIWGWATWRSSWKRFHEGMKLWTYLRTTDWLSDIIENPVLCEYWRKSFDRALDGHVNTWDYQWMFIFFLFGGLSVIPGRNLISNIGFGPDSVNTKDVNSENANLPTYPMQFPLRHPSKVEVDFQADKYIAEKLWVTRYRNNNYIVTDGNKIYE